MSTSTSMHEEMNRLRSSMHVAELLGGRVVGGVGGPKHVSGGGLMLAEQAGVQVPAQRPWPRGSEGGGVGPGGGGRERQEAAPPRGIQEGATTVGRCRGSPTRGAQDEDEDHAAAALEVAPKGGYVSLGPAATREEKPTATPRRPRSRPAPPTTHPCGAPSRRSRPQLLRLQSTSDVRPRPLVGGWRRWCLWCLNFYHALHC
jgi:hypothetical protein